MATATKNSADLNGVTEQVTEMNERLAEAGKRAGTVYLDGYEKFVDGVTAFQVKLADQSKNDAVKAVVTTQVDLTRQLASAYASAARGLIA
ncbi:MAG: hypothetical protein M3Y09_03845 [Actinomycetota bacterium]|nr:hypothetical protein [Actinomycetota bacterium]